MLIQAVVMLLVFMASGDPNWIEVEEGEWPVGVKPHPPSELAIEWSITNPLPWNDEWKEPESKWIDPNFFAIYRQFEKHDYLVLMQKNWLTYCPMMVSRMPIGGRPSTMRWRPTVPPYIGACDYGDRVGLKSFAVYAKHYMGGIKSPPVVEPPPTKSTLEIMAIFAELLFMEVKP